MSAEPEKVEPEDLDEIEEDWEEEEDDGLPPDELVKAAVSEGYCPEHRVKLLEANSKILDSVFKSDEHPFQAAGRCPVDHTTWAINDTLTFMQRFITRKGVHD